MHKRKIIYQLLALAAASGVIISYLLGPGKVLPGLTIYTTLCGLTLFCAEYLWLRETIRLKDGVIDAKWVVTTLVILIMTLIPQVIILTIAAFVWFLALPGFGILAVILLLRLIGAQKQKDPRK